MRTTTYLTTDSKKNGECHLDESSSCCMMKKRVLNLACWYTTQNVERRPQPYVDILCSTPSTSNPSNNLGGRRQPVIPRQSLTPPQHTSLVLPTPSTRKIDLPGICCRATIFLQIGRASQTCAVHVQINHTTLPVLPSVHAPRTAVCFK